MEEGRCKEGLKLGIAQRREEVRRGNGRNWCNSGHWAMDEVDKSWGLYCPKRREEAVGNVDQNRVNGQKAVGNDICNLGIGLGWCSFVGSKCRPP